MSSLSQECLSMKPKFLEKLRTKLGFSGCRYTFSWGFPGPQPQVPAPFSMCQDSPPAPHPGDPGAAAHWALIYISFFISRFPGWCGEWRQVHYSTRMLECTLKHLTFCKGGVWHAATEKACGLHCRCACL